MGREERKEKLMITIRKWAELLMKVEEEEVGGSDDNEHEVGGAYDNYEKDLDEELIMDMEKLRCPITGPSSRSGASECRPSRDRARS